ncbi:NC domain-containing-related-like protein [Gossypium australe]|uniref:NC domain-containing-related-like protein n=1 Tax=Gossypium australe TaxID=47621 RepID=A0A5B6VHX8_9ROSI|nr:NC domain-containing-related-like protein [Gossypium australe]
MVIHLMGPSKTYNLRPCERCGFKPQAGIFKTCLDCFLDGHSLYRYEYDVSYLKLFFKRSGSCSIRDCRPANQVVETAYRLLEDQSFGSYNFFLNNCEDFAVYCKTGTAMSNQTAGLFGFNLKTTDQPSIVHCASTATHHAALKKFFLDMLTFAKVSTILFFFMISDCKLDFSNMSASIFNFSKQLP